MEKDYTVFRKFLNDAIKELHLSDEKVELIDHLLRPNNILMEVLNSGLQIDSIEFKYNTVFIKEGKRVIFGFEYAYGLCLLGVQELGHLDLINKSREEEDKFFDLAYETTEVLSVIVRDFLSSN